MLIGRDYIAYAFANSALLLVCGAACVVFAILTLKGARQRDKDVTLWWIVPWNVLTWFAVALVPARWIWPRLGNPKLSVDFLRTVYETQSDYGTYLVGTFLLLAVVIGKIAIIWRSSNWRASILAGLLIAIAAVSWGATTYHLREIGDFCASDMFECRVK
ncbi:MAG: hypothetical protein DI534_16350 [Leifsonia xyli]|nr:MAG: hypothetical protein DI534_16350 [Leifsonia xyli]